MNKTNEATAAICGNTDTTTKEEFTLAVLNLADALTEAVEMSDTPETKAGRHYVIRTCLDALVKVRTAYMKNPELV